MTSLQDLLNKLIDKGWKPFGYETKKMEYHILNDRREFLPIANPVGRYNINDLCSIGSGLRQFVCENEYLYDLENEGELSRLTYSDGTVSNLREFNSQEHYQYYVMASSLRDNKSKFLLDNILLPTNKDD